MIMPTHIFLGGGEVRHAGFRGTGRDREGWCGQLCVEHDVRTTSEGKQEERGHPGLKGRRGVAPNTGGIEWRNREWRKDTAMRTWPT